jgi:lysophospholipase L1-like esterase
VPRAFALLILALGSAVASAAEGFVLKPGDRVVLIGSALIEREQSYGYWEAALTTRFAGVTFRNLGWSGDTVFGEARASFDPPGVGYKRLIEHTLAIKPTVILLGYGTNESFGGPARLPAFRKQLDKLLDDLAPTRARMVLLSPLRQEDLGRPLPDPIAHNKDVRTYADALHGVAKQGGHGFVDLYELLGDGSRATPAGAYTDDGMHLTAYGTWRSAAALEQGLGLKPLVWRVTIDGTRITAEGARVTASGLPLRFDVTDETLPPCPPPKAAPRAASLPGVERVLCVKGLSGGKYVLKIGGLSVAVASASEWAAGVPLTRGPEFDQAERLRAAIIDKNHQYFYRWRPANETYLFGFRKHEQGQNAAEIPKFDPFVEKMEADIARLRAPVSHTYELTPER